MRFLIIFIFLTTSAFSNEAIDIKNIVINKELKKYDDIAFLDSKNKQINLNNYVDTATKFIFLRFIPQILCIDNTHNERIDCADNIMKIIIAYTKFGFCRFGNQDAATLIGNKKNRPHNFK